MLRSSCMSVGLDTCCSRARGQAGHRDSPTRGERSGNEAAPVTATAAAHLHHEGRVLAVRVARPGALHGRVARSWRGRACRRAQGLAGGVVQLRHRVLALRDAARRQQHAQHERQCDGHLQQVGPPPGQVLGHLSTEGKAGGSADGNGCAAGRGGREANRGTGGSGGGGAPTKNADSQMAFFSCGPRHARRRAPDHARALASGSTCTQGALTLGALSSMYGGTMTWNAASPTPLAQGGGESVTPSGGRPHARPCLRSRARERRTSAHAPGRTRSSEVRARRG